MALWCMVFFDKLTSGRVPEFGDRGKNPETGAIYFYIHRRLRFRFYTTRLGFILLKLFIWQIKIELMCISINGNTDWS